MMGGEGGDGFCIDRDAAAVMAYTRRGYADNELIWQREGHVFSLCR
jgi:hypothetical protein